MFKKILFFGLMFCLAQTTFAQSGSIKGRVLDENNLGLPGATAVLMSKTIGTVTDVNGNFSLVNIPADVYTIQISFIGYTTVTQEVMVREGEVTTLKFNLVSGVMVGEEVLVLGDRLKGQAKALNQQRTNINVTNIVAADQIGRFPDANIGDAMKRIPGITMQNDQGEARDIIIRGFSPELNSVMINGERMPSAEGDNRRLQMDLIPADMVQTIEVNKAVLPDMDADAIGGAVNLVTRNAPNGLRLSGTAASGYNFLANKPIWTGGIVIGNRFLDNKLGVIFSGSYNNHTFGSDNYEAVWVETDNPNYPAVIEEFDLRKYDVQRVRRSVSLALDYQFNPKHSIAFNGMYNHRDDWENRYRLRVDRIERDVWDEDAGAPTGDFNELAQGLYEVSGRASLQTKGGIDNDRVKMTRLEDQRLMNYTLSGSHLFGNLKATWNATFARASEDRPNERYITHRGNTTAVVDIRDPFNTLVTFKDSNDALGLGLNEIYESNNNTFEQDFNARLDFALPFAQSKGQFKFGGRLRSKDKERNETYDVYEPLQGLSAAGDDFGNLPTTAQNEREFLNGAQYVPGNFVTREFLGNLDFSNATLFEKTDALGEYITSNYTASELITAGYAMATYKFNEKFTAVAGIRLENTSLEYQGNEFDVDNETATKSEIVTDNYLNVLPSVHLKYDIAANTIVRLAWTNTLARPNYFDLVPYAAYSPDDLTLERGNPALAPTTATNYDLMFETYFKSVGLFSGGLFYKDINNFIYTRTIQNYNDPQYGIVEFTTRENGGTADVFGFETSLQRQLDFLPGALKGLGIYVNYTFTESSTSGIEGRETEELKLPGTARHMFNASLSYETKKLVARVSLNYASDYVNEFGDDAFTDAYYDRQTFLDVNASYAFTDKLRFFAEANNLTNQPLRFYQGVREQTMQEEYYNVRFNAGLKFDLFR